MIVALQLMKNPQLHIVTEAFIVADWECWGLNE